MARKESSSQDLATSSSLNAKSTLLKNSVTASDMPTDELSSRNSSTMHVRPEAVEALSTPSNESPAILSNKDIKYTITSPGATALEVHDATGVLTTTSTAEEKNVVASTAELLRLAQVAGSSSVQMPATLVATLLSRLSFMGRVQGELSDIKGELKALQRSNDILFPLFKQLPLEIRLMIWRMAAFTPRVVALTCKFCTSRNLSASEFVQKTRLCPLRQVCQEARKEVKKFRELLFTNPGYDEEIFFRLPEVFVNFTSDTIFLQGRTFCYLHYVRMHRIPTHVVPSLAIPFQAWREMIKDTWEMVRSMDDVSYIGSHKVVIVLGKQNVCNAPDAMFIAPRQSPRKLLPDSFIDEQKSKLSNGKELTWKRLEALNTRIVCEYEDSINPARKELVDSKRIIQILDNGIANVDSAEGLDPDNPLNWGGRRLAKPALTWTVKKIRYVETITPPKFPQIQNE